MGIYSDENDKKFLQRSRINMVAKSDSFWLGYVLAWHDSEGIKVVSGLVSTNLARTKPVNKISPEKIPGFCFALVAQVLIDDEWKYDSELTDTDRRRSHWGIQTDAIKRYLRNVLIFSRFDAVGSIIG